MECDGCRSFRCVANMKLGELCRSSSDDIRSWLRCHGLVFGAVACEYNHPRRPCVYDVEEAMWKCTWRVQTRGNEQRCRRKCNAYAPFYNSYGRVEDWEVLFVMHSYITGCCGSMRATEDTVLKLSRQTQSTVRSKMETYVALAMQRRWEERARSVTHMQKDETAFSKIKPGGSFRSKRERQDGCDWYHVLVECTRDQKAVEIFVRQMPDRTHETIKADVLHLAAGANTRVWTDAWAANCGLEEHVRLEVVNHKREWVSDLGIHTNTAEGLNRVLKAELKQRGGQLGLVPETRYRRIMFFMCLINGRLASGGNTQGCLTAVFNALRMGLQTHIHVMKKHVQRKPGGREMWHGGATARQHVHVKRGGGDDIIRRQSVVVVDADAELAGHGRYHHRQVQHLEELGVLALCDSHRLR
eukprot:PhM_4_TR16796/c2_g1_i1/m.97689